MSKNSKYSGLWQHGEKIGLLTFEREVGMRRDGLYVLCSCKCGHPKCKHETELRADHLAKDAVKSCGAKPSAEKHGCASKESPHRSTYRSWEHMIDRCYNEKHPHFDRYGGRGIVVCDRWRQSFLAFLEDMGDRPDGLTLERIETHGNYEPSNCKWATFTEQNRNKTNGTELTHNGETMSVTEWAERLGVRRHALFARLQAGWSAEKTLTTPVRLRRWGKKPEGVT